MLKEISAATKALSQTRAMKIARPVYAAALAAVVATSTIPTLEGGPSGAKETYAKAARVVEVQEEAGRYLLTAEDDGGYIWRWYTDDCDWCAGDDAVLTFSNAGTPTRDDDILTGADSARFDMLPDC